MGVSSEYQIVDISNLVGAAAIEAAIETEVLVMEANGFVVTETHVQPPYLYLLGVLPSFLSQSFEVASATLWIPPRDVVPIGGTWTEVLDGNGVPMLSRAQADGTGTVTVPIVMPEGQTAAARGFQLESVSLVYTVLTAAADAVGELGIQTFTPVGPAALTLGDPILAAVATTIDALHDAAGRIAVGDHNTIATVDTPAYAGARVQYQADITFDAAATTDLDVYGALVTYSATR